MKVNYLYYWSDQNIKFLKTFFNILHQTKSDFLEVKLNRIKTSFSTQIICHVTDEEAEEGA